MRIIVSDSSCLIDLRKASLLKTFLRLPYEILIPNTLFEEELLKFTIEEKALLSGGLKVMDLPGENVLRAQHVVSNMPQLSIHDGFAFALAEMCPGCILLSGDGGLRTLAEEHDIEVRGVLWVMDEIYRNGLVGIENILTVLRLFVDDPTVRLPRRALAAYIKRYESIE
ncbi:MAG: hypothetical protein ABL970_02155 [Nitrospira sp.]